MNQILSNKKEFYSLIEDGECKVCDRNDSCILCKNCGHDWNGRKRIKCSFHRDTLFLMDFEFCPKCFSSDIKELALIDMQTVRRIVECRKDDEVKDIMEALEIEGEKRRIRLNQLLHIEY
ncbi:hypothetical protein BpHYR1_034428 [Brachionus plicatilis]|uniref:Uncharacterized protein n=1 Tax=Brachionus plicatilis TaxID=10195 RepID=A0A3M7TB04_BRAPC|nr:hypothetical protein BpHYR1_034428 [Brachionus plicatilis]